MADTSPIRPRLLKGVLAVYPTHTPGSQPSRVIAFQYNPDTMKRTLAHRAVPAPPGGAGAGATGAAKEDVLRVAGPPVETITMTVDLHASEQLEDPATNPAVAEHGLHPALATLELLMYPPAAGVQKILEQAQRGEVQVSPDSLPLVLLVWGPSRVVPVKLTSFSVSEEAFDTRLNPISAKVELAMQVLTYVEFTASSVGRDAYIAYQLAKEALGAVGQLSNAAGGIRNLLP
jgi:hypothetical protein